jgi:hypothetical protein
MANNAAYEYKETRFVQVFPPGIVYHVKEIKKSEENAIVHVRIWSPENRIEYMET